VAVDGILWVLGTVLGLATAVGFTGLLVRSHAGAPTTVWGLAVVPPMVSATVGAGLVPHLSNQALQLSLLLVTAACFVLSLTLGAVIFTVAYHHHWRVAGLAVAASTTAWIPLGVVGQSTAAVQAMAGSAGPLLPATVAAALQEVANDYGVLMLGLGVPLAAWAVAMTVRGFRRRMPFVPGWWSLTFPIGTLALGAHLLGVGTGLTGFLVAGVVLVVVLGGTWTLCAVASGWAVLTGVSRPTPKPLPAGRSTGQLPAPRCGVGPGSPAACD
jgi:tellurite resistance protein TehA-like permease